MGDRSTRYCPFGTKMLVLCAVCSLAGRAAASRRTGIVSCRSAGPRPAPRAPRTSCTALTGDQGPAEITPGSVSSRPRSAKMDRSRAGKAGPGGAFGRSPALSGAALPRGVRSGAEDTAGSSQVRHAVADPGDGTEFPAVSYGARLLGHDELILEFDIRKALTCPFRRSSCSTMSGSLACPAADAQSLRGWALR